jgi:hypothetical protein
MLCSRKGIRLPKHPVLSEYEKVREIQEFSNPKYNSQSSVLKI